MALTFRKLHRHFVGESSPIELRGVFDSRHAGRDPRRRWTSTPFSSSAIRRSPTPSSSRSAQRLDGRPAPGYREPRLHEEPARQRGALRHLEPRRRRRDHEGRRSPAPLRLGNRLWHTDASLRGSAGALLRCSTRGSSRRCRPTRSTPTCARRMTRCRRRRRPSSRGYAPITRSRTRARPARLRVLAGRAREGEGRRPSARSHHPALAPTFALSRVPRVADHRLADPGGPTAPPRPDGARDAAGVRLSPRLAGGRSRDLGQPCAPCTAPGRSTTRSIAASCAA